AALSTGLRPALYDRDHGRRLDDRGLVSAGARRLGGGRGGGLRGAGRLALFSAARALRPAPAHAPALGPRVALGEPRRADRVDGATAGRAGVVARFAAGALSDLRAPLCGDRGGDLAAVAGRGLAGARPGAALGAGVDRLRARAVRRLG